MLRLVALRLLTLLVDTLPLLALLAEDGKVLPHIRSTKRRAAEVTGPTASSADVHGMVHAASHLKTMAGSLSQMSLRQGQGT